jgi:membrane-associated PAP2 superfamily phosphatase
MASAKRRPHAGRRFSFETRPLPLPADRPAFPRGHFFGALALFTLLTLAFQCGGLDQAASGFYYRQGVGAWPGLSWPIGEWMYRWGQPPATLVGVGGLLAFALSFGAPQRRAWRGPGLYLALLLLLGPGLFSNVLGKGLAGRPRPEDTLGFGGLWEFHRPFQLGLPGRGRSFISGHASAAWYFLGIPFLLQGARRRWAWAASIGFGLLMSWIRVAQGAHWLSDTLLSGAGLWAIAAGLSPLIHWQPSAACLRQPRLRWAVGVGLLAALSLMGVAYEGVRVLGGAAAPGEPAPQVHTVAGPAQGAPDEVMADVELAAGSLSLDLDRPPGSPQPLCLDLEQRGQGLPLSRIPLEIQPLLAGGAFSPGPRTLAVRVRSSLRGWFWWAGGESRLSLPLDLPVDARLRVHGGGAISVGALPPGRRILIARAPHNVVLPAGFQPYGSEGWLRDGRPPLIALDLDADYIVFQDR